MVQMFPCEILRINPSYAMYYRWAVRLYSYSRGGGGNRIVRELSFGDVTTKIWAYSGGFGFYKK